MTGSSEQHGNSGDSRGTATVKTKTPKVVTPVTTTPYVPAAPFNWNSSAGRVPPMDLSKIFGAATGLATQTDAPTYSSPAPPISGNFWETVASPDTIMKGMAGLKTGKDGNIVMPTTPGVSYPTIPGVPGATGKQGTPAGAASPAGASNNPFAMQAFMQSGMMDKIAKVFSSGGVDPASRAGGTVPFY